MFFPRLQSQKCNLFMLSAQIKTHQKAFPIYKFNIAGPDEPRENLSSPNETTN
jgi:hypothetical protein